MLVRTQKRVLTQKKHSRQNCYLLVEAISPSLHTHSCMVFLSLPCSWSCDWALDQWNVTRGGVGKSSLGRLHGSFMLLGLPVAGDGDDQGSLEALWSRWQSLCHLGFWATPVEKNPLPTCSPSQDCDFIYLFIFNFLIFFFLRVLVIF